jgi:signal peptide peptidase SppA
VAIIRLYGPIGGGARTADWVEVVKELGRQKRVPAVVLDIDSPGGDAAASDYLYLALKRLADKKPLVAHIRGTGASGSYLAAMAAARIVVAPSAIVGSIGVISVGPRLPKLLDRIGVRVEEHRAGRLKGMGAPWRDETDEERAREQQLVDAFYDRFALRCSTWPRARSGWAARPWNWVSRTPSGTSTTRSRSRRAWPEFRRRPPRYGCGGRSWLVWPIDSQCGSPHPWRTRSRRG